MFEEGDSSPTPTVSPLGVDPPVSVGNKHSIVTREKAGVIKPKLFSTELSAREPRNISEAFSDPEWKKAAQAEFDALIWNHTWDLVHLPPHRKVIGYKWLFKIKRNLDGSIARRKGRLMAKGCSQVPSCDFKETFSPVVKLDTIRTILSIAVSKQWSLRQVDVNNAFLNRDQLGSDRRPLVCRLTKALYGLRQALRA